MFRRRPDFSNGLSVIVEGISAACEDQIQPDGKHPCRLIPDFAFLKIFTRKDHHRESLASSPAPRDCSLRPPGCYERNGGNSVSLDVEILNWSALFAPADTPMAIRQALLAALRRAMSVDELRHRLQQSGAEVNFMHGDELKKHMAIELESLSRLVRDLSLKN